MQAFIDEDEFWPFYRVEDQAIDIGYGAIEVELPEAIVRQYQHALDAFYSAHEALSTALHEVGVWDKFR